MKSKEPKQPREKKAKSPKNGEARKASHFNGDGEVISHAGSKNGGSNLGANGAPAVNSDSLPSITTEISEEMIRFRAYELYLARGGEDGRHLDDWLAAERELKSRSLADQ